MANSYITLDNSNSSLTKKFRCTIFSKVISKIGAKRLTVTGKVDNQVGPAKNSFQIMVRAYETDPTDPGKTDGATEGFGTLAHLETFFAYDEPSGTPTNVINIKHFDGTTNWDVYLTDTLTPRRVGFGAEGTCAIFDVQMKAVETT